MSNLPMKISVIITAYNSADFIERSVTSVLNQDFQDFELIVVDDGSTDNTCEILQNSNFNLKLISQKNGGPSSARNTGIKAANSDLLCFLDADDYWESSKLSIQYKKSIDHQDVNIFCCNLMNVKNGISLGKRFNVSRIFRDENVYKEGVIENYIQPRGRYSFHAPSSIMVRKSIFNKYGLFDTALKSVEDSEIVLRWAIHGEKIFYQDDVLVNYEIGNQESLTKNVINWSNNHFNYWNDNKYIKNMTDLKKKDFEIMRKYTLLNCIRSVILNGQPIHAFRLLKRNYRNLFSLNYCLLYLLLIFPFNRLRKIRNFLTK